MFRTLIVAALLVSGRQPTQLDENQAACAKKNLEQRKLDDSLQELFRRAQKDAGLTSRLKESQQAWVKFRNAHLDALYGSANPVADYGSVWPMCSCAAEEQLIKERMAHVQRMLSRAEGDLCSWTRP